MKHPAPLYDLAGQWIGTNRLWFTPDMAALESATTATIAPVVAGKFIQISYTWTYEDAPQEGVLLIGCHVADDAATVVFVDSFHMDEGVMVCHGTHDEAGNVDTLGAYAAPDGPDWGWRITIEPGIDTFRLAMYNIIPAGPEALAVEVIYSRTSA